jgi:phosphate transport system permease protein
MTATLTPPAGGVEAPEGTPSPSPPPRPLRRRIRPKDFKAADAALVGLTLLAAYCVVWIVFEQLTLFSGLFGFFVCFVAVFLVFYYVLNRQLFGRRVAADRVTGAVVTLGVVLMLTPLVLLIGFIFVRGLGHITWHFLVSTQYKSVVVCVKGTPCIQPGIFHAIIGTLEQVAFAVVLGVPAGILTAVYLNEVGGRMAQPVRVVVTAMSGLPAIVAGIFVYSVWVLNFGYSGLAGSLALAILLLPTVTRGTEEVLKIVPDDLREASAALGAPQWRSVWSVVLPTARSGILTAVLLGVAVSIGETAPLLFTVFGSQVTNWNLFSGPQAALPLTIYQSVRSPQGSQIAFGYATAAVLFLIVLFVFVLSRILSSSWLSQKARNRMNRKMTNAASRGVAGGPVN